MVVHTDIDLLGRFKALDCDRFQPSNLHCVEAVIPVEDDAGSSLPDLAGAPSWWLDGFLGNLANNLHGGSVAVALRVLKLGDAARTCSIR